MQFLRRITSSLQASGEVLSAIDRRGAAAAELAILLPLVTCLCLTGLDLGQFSYTYLSLGNAGRVGAEYLATRDYSNANAAARRQQLEEVVRADFGAGGRLNGDALLIELEVITAQDLPTRFTVHTTYPFSTTFPWPGIPRPLTLHRSICFHRFR